MIENKQYNDTFFSELENCAQQSAEVVLPLIQEFTGAISLIDIGCGTGVWLKVWSELFKSTEYLGVEGPYLSNELIRIPLDKIIFHDLKNPLSLKKRFDLVMSLEVAEHLPTISASSFIKSLTSLGDIILFSAAIPDQEGTYHINEQYPEYWAKQFRQQNYIPIDCIRPNVWNNLQVASYYKQNILVFINEEVLNNFPGLISYAKNTDSQYLTRIHPIYWELRNQQIRRTKTLFGLLNWKWYMFKHKYIKNVR